MHNILYRMHKQCIYALEREKHGKQRDGIYRVGILEHFLPRSKQTPKPFISKESQDVVCFEKIKTQ